MIEGAIIMQGHNDALAARPEVFRDFTTTDWVTSFSYNFMLWFTIALVFYFTHRCFSGSWIVKSLKVWGLMLMFTLSLLAVVMNHYEHREIYIYLMLSSVISFPIVALANGLLFPWLTGPRGAPEAH